MFIEGLWVRWDKHHSKSVSIYAARANDAENDRLVKELTQLVEREMLVTSEIYACEFVDKVFNQTLVIQEDLQVRDENVIFVSIECYNANFYGDIKNGSFDGIIQCKPGMKPKISDFGAVDDERKRSIFLWHMQTPGISGVDFYVERL